MRYLIAFIMLGLVLSLADISFSQTPDEMTPAEETVCDSLEGAAFGLCNAYCEAMDCDGLDPQASERACNRVLENFLEEIGEPMPPCTPPSVCSEDVIRQCNAETILCNGNFICSHVIGLGTCLEIGCANPQ